MTFNRKGIELAAFKKRMSSYSHHRLQDSESHAVWTPNAKRDGNDLRSELGWIMSLVALTEYWSFHGLAQPPLNSVTAHWFSKLMPIFSIILRLQNRSASWHPTSPWLPSALPPPPPPQIGSYVNYRWTLGVISTVPKRQVHRRVSVI